MRSIVLISLGAWVACSNHDAAAPDGAVDSPPDAYACATPAPGSAAERVPTTTGMIHGARAGTTYA